jgi:uncharacterized protein (DUF433 family)
MICPATHIELRPNREGRERAYIAGTRVRVQALPDLTLGQVHAALGYYFDHRDAILAEVKEDDDFARHFRSLSGPGPLEQRLNEARGGGAAIPS